LAEALVAAGSFPNTSAPQTSADQSSSSRKKTRESPRPVIASVDQSGVSDSDFPMLLDLGPEPSLSEGLSRPKPRLANVFSTTVGSATTRNSASDSIHDYSVRIGRRLPVWLWGSAGLMVVVILSVMMRPMVARSKDKPRSNAVQHGPASIWKQESPIVVRLQEDGEESPVDDLFKAMETAISRRGYIELRNQTPLHIIVGENPNDNAFDFRWFQGTLDLRGALGTVPVIEVELRGTKPFLLTGSGVRLEISGVMIVVHYPGTRTAAPPPPAIQAVGKAKLERCGFKVAHRSQCPGSRAVVSEGGMLYVNRCWFEGFDPAIEVSILNDAAAQIQQTMIVPSPVLPQQETRSPERQGWGVKAQRLSTTRSASKSGQPNLTLDRCTVEGAGLLDMASSSSPTSLEVLVKNCAVRAEALLACNGGGSPIRQVHWLGEGNQYDIVGSSWIVPSANQKIGAALASVTDLNNWIRVVDKDSNPTSGKLNFQTDPRERSGQLQPRDFTIKDSGPFQGKPGANPELVGPWSNR
jgi:hypothetical protein